MSAAARDETAPPVRLHAEGGPFWRVSGGFETPVRLLANRTTAEMLRDDGALARLRLAAQLPGIVPPIAALPSLGKGQCVPMGTTLATDLSQGGLVIPAAIGNAVGTGARAIALPWEAAALPSGPAAIRDAVHDDLVARHGAISREDLLQAACDGLAFAATKGWGAPTDAAASEYGGTVPGADATGISARACSAGLAYFGLLKGYGAFAVLYEVDRTGAPEACGLSPGQAVLVLGAGSSRLGYFVTQDHVTAMARATLRYDIRVPRRELSCAPAHSPEGRRYLANMAAILNICMVNRQYLTHRILTVLASQLHERHPSGEARLLADHTSHGASIQALPDGAAKRPALVHRKGCVALDGDPGRLRLLSGDAGETAWLVTPGPGAHATHHSACGPAWRGSMQAQREAEIVRVVAALKPIAPL